jgi:hypothetical protein
MEDAMVASHVTSVNVIPDRLLNLPNVVILLSVEEKEKSGIPVRPRDRDNRPAKEPHRPGRPVTPDRLKEWSHETRARIRDYERGMFCLTKRLFQKHLCGTIRHQPAGSRTIHHNYCSDRSTQGYTACLLLNNRLSNDYSLRTNAVGRYFENETKMSSPQRSKINAWFC